jgi:hypothetical protein
MSDKFSINLRAARHESARAAASVGARAAHAESGRNVNSSSGPLATSIASLFLSATAGAAGPQPHAGPVSGVIDTVQYGSDQYYVSGWACQQGNRGSIEVHIYASHAAGRTPATTRRLNLFVATLWTGFGRLRPPGGCFTTSADFIHWSQPALAITRNQMLWREQKGNWSYGYFLLSARRAGSGRSALQCQNKMCYKDTDHGSYLKSPEHIPGAPTQRRYPIYTRSC